MKHFKNFGCTALAALALTAVLSAGTASATELLILDTPLGVGAEIRASLKVTTSALLKDTGGSTNDTCTGSEVKGKIEKDTGTGGYNPSGKVSTLTFSGCSHKTTVIAKGELEIKHIAGTTNGTVTSKGAEVTFQSTVFGISCTAKTGTGTTIGTLTGATSGLATMHINGVIPLPPFCGDSTWTGTYLLTLPMSLYVEES